MIQVLKRRKKLLDDLVTEDVLKNAVGAVGGGMVGAIDKFLPNVSGTKSAPPGEDARPDTLLDTMDEFLNSSKKDDLKGEDVEKPRITPSKAQQMINDKEKKAREGEEEIVPRIAPEDNLFDTMDEFF